MSAELSLAEDIARYGLAAYRGWRTDPAGTVSFAGANLTARKSKLNTTKFVRLKSLASAAGWSLATGAHGITGQATKPGRQTTIFVAGANAYKRGAQWIDLPDTTVLVDGELWVPTAATSVF